jgi:5-methyltetrahydropteroyltriglutamate--homocysteine methyltransferase
MPMISSATSVVENESKGGDVTRIARADVIGSLLRPSYLQEARKAAREGKLDPAQARAAEDRAIAEAVALQENTGLDAVTDGEFRRMSFIATIGVRDAELGPLTGFKTLVTDAEWTGLWKYPDGSFGGLTLPEDPTKARRSIVVDKVGVKRDIVADEFPFLKAHTHKAQAKYTFPAPSWHRVAWDPKHSRDAYRTATDFLLAMRDYIRDVVKELIAKGCTYIHMDAPNYAQWHTDPKIRAAFASWGHDMDKELIEDAEIDNSVFDGITGITRAIHLCRGNAPRGRWLANGGYEAIADRLYPRLTNYDTLLLEYDSPRAGDFSSLAHVRSDTTVVLGLITTKAGKLEDPNAVETRIREASKMVPLERLALSPQCGFASGEYADTMTVAEQEAKLRLVADVARRVWPNG